MAASLIGATPETLGRLDGPLGQLSRRSSSWKVLKQISWSDQRPSLGHFRDRSGAEVDIILEYPDGRVVGIEVKATSSPRPADANGLDSRLGFLAAAILNAPAADQSPTNTAAGDVLLTGSLGRLVKVPTNEVPEGLLPPPTWG